MFFGDNRNPITVARFPSRKLDNMRIQGIRRRECISLHVFFVWQYFYPQRVAGRGASRNPCRKWSREVSAAWFRVGFSTSRLYILIIIIVVESLDANAWTHLNLLKLRMRWERERGGGEGRKEGNEGGRKGDDSCVLCKNAQTSVFGDNSQLVVSSATTPSTSLSPDGGLLSFALPPLFPSTLSHRSGLRGLAAVKGRVVLKGTLKRMPPDANCTVRERLALSAIKNDREMISREQPRDLSKLVYAIAFDLDKPCL